MTSVLDPPGQGGQGEFPQKEVEPKKKFRELCGVWSEEEYQGFESAVQDLGEVNPEEWR